jgi:hypothetical protein
MSYVLVRDRIHNVGRRSVPIEHTNASAFVEGYRPYTQKPTTEVKISTFRHDRTPHLIIIK